MTVDKRISYEVQGGAKNYLGKQKEVTAPIKWKSSPDSPETELAYITKAEKDLLVKKDLHGSLKNGVNRGPSGIMSLDGYGSFDGPDPSKDTGMSGVATSAAESGGGSGADRKELDSYINYGSNTQLPPGVNRKLPSDIQDYRSAFIAAGGGQRVNPGFFDSRNTVSRAELARAKAYNPAAFKAVRGGGLSSFLTGGGFLGNIIRGIGQAFGLGKKYNEPTYDMSGINTRVYEGTMDPTVNPEYYNDLGNELMLSTKASPATGFVTATGTGYPGANKFKAPRKRITYGDTPSVGDYLTDEMFEEQFGNFNTIKPTNLNDYQGINSLKLETPKQQAEDDFLKGAMAELTDKQKKFIDSKKFPLQENLITPQSVFDTITNPDLGIYDTGTFGFGAQEPTTEEEYNDYLRSLGLTQTI